MPATRRLAAILAGDVVVEDGDIFGDGVNVAARLEGIAEPGGICISEDAFRQVRGKVAAEYSDILSRIRWLFRAFDKAAAKLLLSIQGHPGHSQSYRTLAACYAHMGRLDEARATVSRLRAITPLVVPTDSPFRNPEDREL
jgi:hypothetical protein